MVSRKTVIVTGNKNANFELNFQKKKAEHIMVFTGKFEIETLEKTPLRKFTAIEKHDFINRLRTTLSYELGLVDTLNQIKRVHIEDVVQYIWADIEKMRIRSYLKSFTPPKGQVYLNRLANKLKVDDEILLDVLQTEFRHLEIIVDEEIPRIN